MYNFTIRLHQNKVVSILSCIQAIVLSDIALVSKPTKHGDVCLHLSNQRKYGYTIKISKPFNKVSGSLTSPSLTFKGEYIDIEVKNFPRFPVVVQDKYTARNNMNGHPCFDLNNGFPIQLLHRKIEILIANTSLILSP